MVTVIVRARPVAFTRPRQAVSGTRASGRGAKAPPMLVRTPHRWVRPKRQLPPGFIDPVPADLRSRAGRLAARAQAQWLLRSCLQLGRMRRYLHPHVPLRGRERASHEGATLVASEGLGCAPCKADRSAKGPSRYRAQACGHPSCATVSIVQGIPSRRRGPRTEEQRRCSRRPIPPGFAARTRYSDHRRPSERLQAPPRLQARLAWICFGVPCVTRTLVMDNAARETHAVNQPWRSSP